MKKIKKLFEPTRDDLLFGVVVGVESAHAFSAFNPSIFTIASLAVPNQQENLIRMGYVPSVAFAMILGGAISAMRKNLLPLLFGAGTCAFMISVYELAIAQGQQTQKESQLVYHK